MSSCQQTERAEDTVVTRSRERLLVTQHDDVADWLLKLRFA
jgi:hypothetical protein